MLDRLIDLFVRFFDAFHCLVVIDAYQEAIVLRLGKFQRALKPGIHFLIPGYIERAIVQDVVPTVHTLSPQSLSTRDGQACVVQAILTWRVNDIRKMLLDVSHADAALCDASHGIIATHVAGLTWDQLCAAEAMEGAQKEIRRRAFRWGIEVVQVQISDLQRCKSLRLWQERR